MIRIGGRHFLRITPALFLAVCLPWQVGYAQPSTSPQIRAEDVLGHKEQPSSAATVIGADTPAARFSAAIRLGQVGDLRFRDPKGMDAFYGARAYRPLWVSEKGPVKQVDAVLDVLDRAWNMDLIPPPIIRSGFTKKLKKIR
jgi:hypothetical protein